MSGNEDQSDDYGYDLAHEVKAYLADLKHRSVNFDVPPQAMTRENGWIIDGADAEVATEPEGPPVTYRRGSAASTWCN